MARAPHLHTNAQQLGGRPATAPRLDAAAQRVADAIAPHPDSLASGDVKAGGTVATDATTAGLPASAAALDANSALAAAAGLSGQADLDARHEVAADAALAGDPVTAEAPSTRPAGATHLPAPGLLPAHAGLVDPATGIEDGLTLDQSGAARTGLPPAGALPDAPLLDPPLLDPLPADPALADPGPGLARIDALARAQVGRPSVVDHLLDHPDAVVRARAIEAQAAVKHRAADAGIKVRAALDTAHQVDRQRGIPAARAAHVVGHHTLRGRIA